MGLTADEIVKKYIELRDFCRLEEEALDTKLKPYKEAMQLLEGAAAQMIRDTKQTSLHTEWGTAYQEHGNSVTIEDPELWFRFLFALVRPGTPEDPAGGYRQARNFLTKHVSKDAVMTFVEQVGQGHPPPGVKLTPYTKTQFRRL
jgi:hypothetical protein